MKKNSHYFAPDEPLKLTCHGRPKTRRELISQGFKAGMGSVVGSSFLGMMGANKALAQIQGYGKISGACGEAIGGGRIPFISFDLAGGANIAGSNVLVGGPGGQGDFLSNAGYSKQGLPSDLVPSSTANVDTSLGLAFHSDSAFLRGILSKVSETTRANINGSVIAARSENDTGNNPHNPMYAINKAGANGNLVALVGSRSSDSGANSMAPANMIDLSVRPTKIDRPSDVLGLVDVGDFGALTKDETVAVMQSAGLLSDKKMDVFLKTTYDQGFTDSALCAYAQSAFFADEFSDASALDPESPDIVGPNSIFTAEEFASSNEYRKTASVMKMVIDRYAGAGTITMGGYDYHTGDRSTGEQRDFRAGECMGACLEYAAQQGEPLMLYVYTDGSVFSNGNVMASEANAVGGKSVWTGDSQQTSAAFFLVYNPGGAPAELTPNNEPAIDPTNTGRVANGFQVGYMRPGGDVETSSSPAANNVNQLVQTVMLNYMSLNGEANLFDEKFASSASAGAVGTIPGAHGLGSEETRQRLVAFGPLTS